MFCHHAAHAECFSCPKIDVPYAEQIKTKTARIQQLLAPFAGPELFLEPACSREKEFRNKAKLVVSGSANEPILGMPGNESVAEVDLSDCPLYEPAIHAAIEPIKQLIKRAQLPPYDIAKKRGDLKYVLITSAPSGDLMIRFVLRRQDPMARIKEHLPTLQAALPNLKVFSCNIQPLPAAIIEGEEEYVLTAHDTLTMNLELPVSTDFGQTTRPLPLHLGTRSFFQTNTKIAEQLYGQVWEWANSIRPASVWDLFCGVGGFALTCADALNGSDPDIHGIEISAAAIASAQRSAKEMGVSAEFSADDAGAWLTSAKLAPEMLIVNPPRRGIGAESAQAIENLRPDYVVYSSCNPVTLAQDLKVLKSYEIQFVRLMDMFNYTDHTEVIVLLKNK